MNEKKPKFDDLDDRFYALPDPDESLLAYVHGNKALFHFQGEIERPVLPK